MAMDEDVAERGIGLVGDDDLAGTIREAGTEPVTGDADAVLAADPDVVVAVGEGSLLALAKRRPEPPVLPVGAGAGVRSIPRSAVVRALSEVAADAHSTAVHPLLSVDVAGERAGLAFLDATVVAAEPARISAFGLAVGDETAGPLRADGIVVATPAGTAGYVSRLGTPALSPETGVMAVEPIGQFATAPDSWVVPDDGVTVTVERDEVPVTALADDSAVAEVGPDEPVTVARDGSVETVVVAESAPALVRGEGELEKH